MSEHHNYTSSFMGRDGVSWRIAISALGYDAEDPVEIRLDADNPVVIEWPETKLYDPVCSSICTVKVVNESDRQMIDLAKRRCNWLIEVFRNGVVYWNGRIDDSVYEEPYSYRRNYVTELTFSDFGCLNQELFTMSGRRSFAEILRDILNSTGFAHAVFPAFSIRPARNQLFDYDKILIDADVFSSEEGCSKYDITKREWVLEGDTVRYLNWEDLRRALDYDIKQEKAYSYNGVAGEEVVKHLTGFVAGLWQIHPFGEGNTRTTAVFTILYLRSIGFNVENDLFAKHSWYFRNALVRANYKNAQKGIDYSPVFLERFFRNLLLGEQWDLRNRYLDIRAPKE